MRVPRVLVRVAGVDSAARRLHSRSGAIAAATLERIRGLDFEVFVGDFGLPEDAGVQHSPFRPPMVGLAVCSTSVPIRRDAAETRRLLDRSGGTGLDIELIVHGGVLEAMAWDGPRPMHDAVTVRLVASSIASVSTALRAGRDDSLWPRSLAIARSGARWETWKRLRIAIIGCGRLGGLVAASLLAQGIRRFVLIDGDLLDDSNLDGMDMPAINVGDHKVVVLGREMARRRALDELVTVNAPLAYEQSIEALVAADVLITTVDHDAPRLLAAALARRLLQIQLDIGTSTDRETLRSGADVRLLIPSDRCILCLGGVADPSGRDMASARRAGTSVRGINAVAAHVGVQMLMAAELGVVPARSRWQRIAIAAGGEVSSEEMSPASESACPWCSIPRGRW